MNPKEAIKILELMSCELEKAANKPENYNTEWAYYLGQMSWSLHRHANDLREMEYLLGMSPLTKTSNS